MSYSYGKSRSPLELNWCLFLHSFIDLKDQDNKIKRKWLSKLQTLTLQLLTIVVKYVVFDYLGDGIKKDR